MAQPKSASEFLIVSVIVVGDSERPDFWTEAQLIPKLRSLIDGCPGFRPLTVDLLTLIASLPYLDFCNESI